MTNTSPSTTTSPPSRSWGSASPTGAGRTQRNPEDILTNGHPTIAVLGGTGALGSALAQRWGEAGYPVVLGSRAKEKAEAAAHEMRARNASANVRGEDNLGAAAAGDVVVPLVP